MTLGNQRFLLKMNQKMKEKIYIRLSPFSRSRKRLYNGSDMRQDSLLNKKTEKKLSPFCLAKLSLLTLSFSLVTTAAFLITPSSSVSAEEDSSYVVPESETVIDSTELSITVLSSAKTDISESLSVRFSSNTAVGYDNGTRNKSVYVVVDDASYDPMGEFGPKEDGTLPEFNAYVYWIDFTGRGAKNETMYIPSVVTQAGKMRLNITRIAETACWKEALVTNKATPTHTADDYNYGAIDAKLQKIAIPSSIETIDEGAFASFPANLTLSFVAASEPATFVSGWTDAAPAQIEWGASHNESSFSVGTSSTKTFGAGKDFLAGYYGEGELDRPLLATYDVVDREGNLLRSNQIQTVEKNSGHAAYYGIGASVGENSTSISVDFDLPANEFVNPSSLVFHNIFSPVFNRVPDDEGKEIIDIKPEMSTFYSGKAKVSSSFRRVELSDLVTVSTGKITTFGNFIQLDAIVDVAEGFYEKLNAATYKTYEDKIRSGEYEPRMQFSSLVAAEYRFYYEGINGEVLTKEGKIGTPVSYFILSSKKPNTVGFMFDMSWVNKMEGDAGTITYQNLIRVELRNFVLKTDIWNISANNYLQKTNFNFHFGAINLMPDGKENTKHVDLILVYLIGSAIYAGVFAAAAVGYYFYAKRRFRNDEFLRVNDKRFLFNSLKNFVGYGLVFLAILTCIARWGIMNTSVVALNPLDVMVIIFVLAGAIFLGFSIKNMVLSIRNMMKRRQFRKLKLDLDKVEDGTR